MAYFETLIELALQVLNGPTLPLPKVIAQLANKLVKALGAHFLQMLVKALKIFT